MSIPQFFSPFSGTSTNSVPFCWLAQNITSICDICNYVSRRKFVRPVPELEESISDITSDMTSICPSVIQSVSEEDDMEGTELDSRTCVML